MTDTCAHRYLSYVVKGYPLNPSQLDKDTYKYFFYIFGFIIPDENYRILFLEYLQKSPMTDLIMDTKKSLYMWFFQLKNPNPYLDLSNDLEIENVNPKEWGALTWSFYVDVVNTYNLKETDKYKLFFEYQQYVLPCFTCRDNYAIDLQIQPLTDNSMSNRESLMKWLDIIRFETNRKINVQHRPLQPQSKAVISHARSSKIPQPIQPQSNTVISHARSSKIPQPIQPAKIARRPPLPTSYQPPQSHTRKGCARCK